MACASRRNIELLTTVKAVDDSGVLRTRCFGNILELADGELVLESNREQRPGERVTLSLVFPGQRSQEDPVVNLGCLVRAARDPERLHYDLEIQDMDDRSRERLLAYLDHAASETGS